jgi:hypothetical protein
MTRFRLTTAAVLAVLGLACGCSNMGNGSLFERFGFRRNRPECECIETGCARPSCCEGPTVEEPCTAGGAFVPGGVIAPGPLPMPHATQPPLAQPFEAKPSSILRDAGK